MIWLRKIQTRPQFWNAPGLALSKCLSVFFVVASDKLLEHFGRTGSHLRAAAPGKHKLPPGGSHLL